MDGILNIYKEKGWTSFDVIHKLRGILREKKLGHSGTLDPMAEGVLVICAGRATKLVEAIQDGEKVYAAELELGKTSDTEDITGRILTENEIRVSEETIRETVLSFIGELDQIPPMYSAKHQDGKRLYALAREGKVVERKPNRITIYDIQDIEISLPKLRFTVRCSKGTYIRTLCRDIGERIGCGAVMTALKRVRVGSFSVQNSYTLKELQRLRDEGRIRDAVLPPFYSRRETVMSFGKFDGSHLGHQKIFEEMFRIQRESGEDSVILTFTKNIESVLTGQKKPRISSEQEHLSRLQSFGFSQIFEYPMTKESMAMSAEDFIEKVLVQGLHVRDLVVGEDASFGNRALGNVALLREKSKEYGFRLHVVKKEEVLLEDGRFHEISSSLIREVLRQGDVKRARDLMGRYFCLSGVVQQGRQLGRTLDFPTANLAPTAGKLLPVDGVYVSRVFIDRKLYRGMTNVGKNPTVSGENDRTIETYVLDFSGDLYGRKIRVDFVDRVRGEIEFSSVEELKSQLKKDMKFIRDYPRDDLS